MQNRGDPYLSRTIERPDAHEPHHWYHLGRVPDLDAKKGEAVIGLLLELACQCQNTRNIRIARDAILAIPRDLVLRQIEQVAEPMLRASDDDWVCRRLKET
jgi:hypothetical protein